MVSESDLETILSSLRDTRSFYSFSFACFCMFILFVIMFVVFLSYRRHPFFCRRDQFFASVNKQFHVVPNSHCWILDCLFWHPDKIFSNLGIDALFLLKTTKMLLILSTSVSFLSLSTVLPVHLILGEVNHTVLMTTSLAVVPAKSKLLWVHLGLVYIITCVVCLILYFEWKGAVRYRQKYFLSDPMSTCSLLFYDLENSPSEGCWESYISENVRKIAGTTDDILVYNLRNYLLIRPLIKTHNKLIQARILVELKSHVTPKIEILAESNSSIDQDKNLEVLNSMISTNYQKLEMDTRDASRQNLPAAVVMVSNVGLAQTFRVTSLSLAQNGVKVSPLPEHTSLLWHNLELGKKIRTINSGLIMLLTAVVILFWGVPFALVAALTKYISSKISNNDSDSKILNTFVHFLISSVIPLILIQTILYIEHLIFRKLSTYENHVSHASSQFSILRKMCLFNAINVFLIYTISSSIFVFLNRLINSPFSISISLASAIPLQSNFYMIYLAFHTLIMLPWFFIKGSVFLWELPGKIRRYYNSNSETPRDHLTYDRPTETPYIYLYSYLILVFGIGFVFSPLSPLISITWVPYFLVAYFFFAYDEERNNVCRYIFAGGFWPIVSDAVLCYLVFMQIIMMGMFSIKENFVLTLLVIPSCLFTYIFSRLINNHFRKAFDFPTCETMNLMPPITSTDMYNRCKHYYIESFVPPMNSTSVDQRYLYILEREIYLRENSRF